MAVYQPILLTQDGQLVLDGATPLNGNQFQLLAGDSTVFDANAVNAATQQVEFAPAVNNNYEQLAQTTDTSAQYVQVSNLSPLLFHFFELALRISCYVFRSCQLREIS